MKHERQATKHTEKTSASLYLTHHFPLDTTFMQSRAEFVQPCFNRGVNSEEFAIRRYAAIELAKHAGALIVRSQRDAQTVESKSSFTDIVTAVDKAAEAGIVKALARDFAADGVYAEESPAKDSDSGYTWIIDPLDGTANYVRHLRSSVVSIALAFNDVVRLGVVFDPYADEVFVGVMGEGATCNGRRLDVSSAPESLDRCFVGVSGSNREGPRRSRSELVSRLVHDADSVRDVGSTALSLCWTAAGRFDAHIGMDVAWWDLAAGVVIAREAGCEMSGFNGETEPVPEGFVVAPPSIMSQLQDVLTDIGL
jgi:myo-inositol-1(or 4)-monophosphatase